MNQNVINLIGFWADIVTIFSILLALYIFLYDRDSKKKDERQRYINRLISLGFELTKNNEVIVQLFIRDKDAFTGGRQIGYYRFSTFTTNEIISKGTIRDMSLLRNLDAIAHAENQANRIMDDVQIAYSTTSGDMASRQHTLSKIKSASESLYAQIDLVVRFLPGFIEILDLHIRKEDLKSNSFFRRKKSEYNGLPKDLFKS